MPRSRLDLLLGRIEAFLDALFSRPPFRRLGARARPPLLSARAEPAPPSAGPPGPAEDPARPVHLPAARPVSRVDPEGEPAEPEEPPEPRGPAPRLLLTVDDAGQYLVVVASAVVIGHARTGLCDLPFLADVGSRHARLSRRETLHGGATWRVEPLEGETVLVNGRPARAPARLIDGDVVQLGANLTFRFGVPDPASSSAVLDLLHGAECLGAGHALLVAEGDEGRVRIGAAAQRHVRVPNLLHAVTLVAEGARLLVRCEAGVSDGASAPQGTFALPLPPPQRVDLAVGGPREESGGVRPPFGLSLSPVDDPAVPSPSEGREA